MIDMPFVELNESWATSVAENLIEMARINDNPYFAIFEAWLAEDLAIYCRHFRMETRLGTRFGHLDVNPTTETRAVSSSDQAFF